MAWWRPLVTLARRQCCRTVATMCRAMWAPTPNRARPDAQGKGEWCHPGICPGIFPAFREGFGAGGHVGALVWRGLVRGAAPYPLPANQRVGGSTPSSGARQSATFTVIPQGHRFPCWRTNWVGGWGPPLWFLAMYLAMPREPSTERNAVAADPNCA